MSDTPETDAVFTGPRKLPLTRQCLDLCRKLERERDEARKNRDSLLEIIKEIQGHLYTRLDIDRVRDMIGRTVNDSLTVEKPKS